MPVKIASNNVNGLHKPELLNVFALKIHKLSLALNIRCSLSEKVDHLHDQAILLHVGKIVVENGTLGSMELYINIIRELSSKENISTYHKFNFSNPCCK